jgi:hypothetical protein
MTLCDALVAGGGSAGLAAAIAAARAGADTILVERGGCLGGMATGALVHTVCGLYELREEPGAVIANPGFAGEFAGRLIAAGGRGPVRMGRLDVLPHDPVVFAAVADELALETGRLRVWLHTEVIAAEAPGGRIECVEIFCRGRRETIQAGAFIDATGDATLTALAGGAFAQSPGECLQRPAYIAALRGIPDSLLDQSGRISLALRIASAVKAGDLPETALGAAFRGGVSPGQAFVTIDLEGGDAARGAWDPLLPGALTQVEMTGRRTALALARYLDAHVEGCRGCAVAHWPARAGVRESRRAAGVCELRGGDVLDGADFDDGVVSVAWPLELRERATGPRWRFPRAGVAARIPLRALRHRDVENLWIAGRCIACDHEAQAAIRVMGTGLATGEAAGLAAVETLGARSVGDWPALARRVMARRAEGGP